MCTSIISNRKKTIVGWNLDILDMEYRVRTDKLGVYIEINDAKEGWMPLFGANSRGDFVGMPTCWPFDKRSDPVGGEKLQNDLYGSDAKHKPREPKPHQNVAIAAAEKYFVENGALLPLALPRMKAVHPVVMAAGYAGKIDGDANLKSFWFDVAGSPNAESVKRLIKLVPPERILYGSDFPYVPSAALSAGLSKFKEELSQDPELSRYKNAILYENAAKLLGLKNFKSAKAEQKNEEK